MCNSLFILCHDSSINAVIKRCIFFLVSNILSMQILDKYINFIFFSLNFFFDSLFISLVYFFTFYYFQKNFYTFFMIFYFTTQKVKKNAFWFFFTMSLNYYYYFFITHHNTHLDESFFLTIFSQLFFRFINSTPLSPKEKKMLLASTKRVNFFTHKINPKNKHNTSANITCGERIYELKISIKILNK